MSVAAPSTPLLRTPLHHWHAAHGARLSDRHGWLVPAYPSVAGTAPTLSDLSFFAKVSFFGDGAILAVTLLGEGAASMPRGVASFGANGEALACRVAADRLFIFAARKTIIDEHLATLAPSSGLISADLTSALAGFQLAGEQHEKVLGRLTSLDVSSKVFPPGTCAETGLAGVHALLVRPPGPASHVQIFVPWDLGEYVWERILEAGTEEGLRPVGFDQVR